MDAHQIAHDAIKILNKKIVNEVFLTIQNNHFLMQEYLRAVEAYGLESVNQTIGKAAQSAYNLAQIEAMEGNFTCTLIQGHKKF